MGGRTVRVDVDADRSLRHRRDHKIAAISRLFRCLLSYLQPGNAWKQSAAADVGLIWSEKSEEAEQDKNKEQLTTDYRLRTTDNVVVNRSYHFISPTT